MDADDGLDLFGDEEETDHFFLPEHYAQNDSAGFDAPTPYELPIDGTHGTNGIKHEVETNSIASDGLSDDEELPEEEEAANPLEDINYEDLIAQAQRNLDAGAGEAGADVHLPDLGGLPAGASGAMARWMAGVQESDRDAADMDGEDDFRDAMSKEEILREYYPSFRADRILDFSDLFSAKATKHQSAVSRKARQVVPNKLQLDIEPSASGIFKNSTRRKRKYGDFVRAGIVDVVATGAQRQDSRSARSLAKIEDVDKDDFDTIMACEEWEIASASSSQEAKTPPTAVTLPKLHFLADDHDVWMNEDIFDGSYQTDRVVLNMNDPRLHLAQDVATRSMRQSKHMQPHRRYNYSNDEAYAMLQASNQSRIRSNIAQLSLEHAGFSDRLQSPFYKTTLSKSEARAYHRPTMTFKPNQVIKFSRVKPRKKKDKDRSRDPKVLFKNSKDMSLADNAGFLCLEYSEEYPTILSNSGMASKIVNYYRKRSEEDEARPAVNYGEASILGVSDRSPFWNFGFVDPGESTLSIYNKMYRAPVFKHTPNNTDFLLIKSSTKLGTRFYLRSMKHLFVVGQTMPAVDIPGPGSRKVTTSYKNRLKMITYRLIRKNENQRLLVKDLMKHFPDQTELQIRTRLKDFMEFQRKGEDQNFWKLKSGEILPGEEATRSMIDPETVCLLESMQVGSRHLEDSGYGKSADAEDEQEENMAIEQQLAPWISTHNFINATQGKAMLQLYGEGDPTGRGEGLSFIRTSMKGGFKVAGESVNDTLDHEKPVPKGAHAYNVAKQQKAYEDEIARIWRAQKTSLSMTDNQVLDRDALENQGELLEGESPFPDVAPSPSAGSEMEDDLISLNSGISASSSLNKVLKIQRVSRNSSGELVTSLEIVRDPHVIHAYMAKRRTMEEEQIQMDGALFERSADPEQNERAKKIMQDELMRLKRNAERRKLRKSQKDAGTLKSKAKKNKKVETVGA